MMGWTATSPKRRPASREANASKYTKEDSIMKDTSFRTFTIPRSNGCTPFKFAVHTLADDAVQVTRISPYDETEYHWALKSPGAQSLENHPERTHRFNRRCLYRRQA